MRTFIKATFLIFTFIALAIPTLRGQTDAAKAVKIYQRGETQLLKGNTDKAIELFKQAIQLDYSQCPFHRSLGATYELTKNYEQALSEYEIAIGLNSRFSRVLYYEIAVLKKKLGDPEDAINYFNKFESYCELPDTDFGINGQKEAEYEVAYRLQLDDQLASCKLAIEQNKYTDLTSVYNLGENINTFGEEYFPYLTNDQSTLFFTYRIFHTRDENLFYANKIQDKWGPKSAVQGKLNTESNEGMCTFTKDGRQMFYTACGGRGVIGGCDILKANIDTTFTNSVSTLEGYVNSESWESQASISCDGRIMYFASNRIGGLGGSDIWYSNLQTDGSWSEAINAGRNINTDGDEEAPFITSDGKTLYFSSTGHVGLGEQDLFFSRVDKEGLWGTSINLGKPINTPFRELGFFLSADGKNGYFSSDRPNGFGGMDIYKFELTEKLISDPIVYIQGTIVDSLTNMPLQATYKINSDKSFQTDSTGQFFLCYPADQQLQLDVTHPDYIANHRMEIIPTWDNKEFYPLDIKLAKKPSQEFVKSKPPLKRVKTKKPPQINKKLYFDFNQATLTESSLAIIEELTASLTDTAVIKATVIGFCDPKGENAYNQSLSLERAKTVAEVLQTKGFTIDTVHGRGEINNDQEDELNRRVEISIWLE